MRGGMVEEYIGITGGKRTTEESLKKKNLFSTNYIHAKPDFLL